MHDGHGNVGGGHEGGGAQHDGVLFDRYRNMFVIARRYFNGNGGDIDSARGAVIFSSRQILETAVAFPPLSSQARHG